MKTPINADDALAKIQYSIEYADTHGGCPPAVRGVKRSGVEAAKAEMRRALLEIVGEDEKKRGKANEHSWTQQRLNIRNDLRHELRPLIYSFFGIEHKEGS